MGLCQTTLSPVNVQLGGTDAGLNDGNTLPAPVSVGGGSLADSSDTSYIEIGSRYSDDEGGERTDLLLADFVIDTAAYPGPAWMYVSMRAKNEAGYGDALDAYSLFPRMAWYRADGGGALLRQNVATPLRNGAVTSPTWLDQVYQNLPIVPGEPGDDTNWLNLPRDWPEMLDPLTTTGLRLGVYCTSSAPTRVPLFDIYELRLVVAYECGAVPYIPPTRVTPSLRMLQRGGSGGMSGIPRMVGDPTRRGIRQGPGSIY